MYNTFTPFQLKDFYKSLSKIPTTKQNYYQVYLKGFMTKLDLRHFWKAEIKDKKWWYFPLYLCNFRTFNYL